jgi:hypothetical protein
VTLVNAKMLGEALNLLEEIALFDGGLAGDRAMAFMQENRMISRTVTRVDGPDDKIFSINDMRHLCYSVVETFGESAPGAAAAFDPDYLFPINTKENTDA